LPFTSVVAEVALRVPQSVVGLTKVKETRSFAMPLPATVAVTVVWLLPSAVIGFGLALTEIVLVAVPFCVMTVVVLLPVPASVEVTVQKPGVVLDV
jgi:hypothetical protein